MTTRRRIRRSAPGRNHEPVSLAVSANAPPGVNIPVQVACVRIEDDEAINHVFDFKYDRSFCAADIATALTLMARALAIEIDRAESQAASDE